MKRIMVRPGKFVLVSDELVAKSVRAAATNPQFTREDVERMIAAEPRWASVFAGPIKPSRRQGNIQLRKAASADASAHQRVALKVRQMLAAAAIDAHSFDVDKWVYEWMNEPLARLSNKTPAQTIHAHGGWEAIEAALDSMRGGLPG